MVPVLLDNMEKMILENASIVIIIVPLVMALLLKTVNLVNQVDITMMERTLVYQIVLKESGKITILIHAIHVMLAALNVLLGVLMIVLNVHHLGIDS